MSNVFAQDVSKCALEFSCEGVVVSLGYGKVSCTRQRADDANGDGSNVIVLASLSLAQEKPLSQPELAKKPMYERLLKGDDAKKVADLDQNLEAAVRQDEAIKIQEEIIALRTRVQGADHWEVINEQLYLKTLRSLDADGRRQQQIAIQANRDGFQLNAKGRYNEAQPLLQKALEIYRKALGEDHPDTARSYNNLAYNLNAQGKATEAQPLYQKALAISRKVLGEDHPDTANIYKNVAFNLAAQGKAAEALPVLLEAIFSHEASRLSRAKGIERAIGEDFNPRQLLAAMEQAKSPVEAWTQVELSLSRGLLDQQGRANARLSPQEVAELTQLQNRIQELQSQILVLASQPKRPIEENTKLNRLVQDRREAGEKLAQLAVAASTRTVATSQAIQAAIPAASALLLWVDMNDNSGKVQEHFACVVRREGEPFWVRLPGTGEQGKWTKDDTTLLAKVRTGLAADVTPGNLPELRQQLRRQRIEPVLGHLKKHGITQLFVVGVNEMAGIPVEVLAPEFVISYVPFGTFLARLPKRPKFDNTLLAVGDPIYELKKGKPVELTALPPNGLLIQDAVATGAAAKAGIRSGDVLLKYGDLKLDKLDQLRPAIQKLSEAGDKTVSVTVWRVDDTNQAKEMSVTLPVGPLGVVFDLEPAPIALADRRKNEALFAKLRGGEVWTDLPGTRFEVIQIAKFFPSAKVLVDGQANERGIDALRLSGELGKFRYLHFATHGKSNNVTAFESKLILSQDQPKEEIKAGEPYFNNEISAREVLEFWKLNADLVTLSACQSGLGKSGSGDGLLGFAQAFLLTGARSVCLSLWEVDDTATALLMQRFYQNLLGQRPGLTQPLPKVQALREAKYWLKNLSTKQALEATATLKGGVSRGSRGEIQIKSRLKADAPPESKPYADPHFWSAFILIGDPD